MPLSQAQQTQLETSAQAVIDLVTALVPDPVPDPRDAEIATLTAANAALQAKIDKVKADVAADLQ